MEKKLNLSAMELNNRIAAETRALLCGKGIFTVNIIGSPGCGKTAILEYTANHFDERFAVIVGDVKTALDSDRIIRAGHDFAYPIETGGGCHLSAQMIRQKIAEIDLDKIDFLFIENVGNLVCPSAYDLGEDLKIAVLSIPEGDEKVRKYPALFLRAGVVIINKVDLLAYLEYDIERVKTDCLAHNPGVRIFETSTRTGVGLDRWLAFLQEQKKNR
ncbi:MAG: hydrogenase nickel incorporation protein HypB [Candidatus Aminicenantes bacterium]|nr:hydrogenase nickel incorporation protein HypB [Candidatus Aminicenantes bacterium]